MKKALILLTALSPVLLGCIPASEGEAAAPPKIRSVYDGTPAPRGDTMLRRTMMQTHNAARRDVGAAALSWDNTLARSAQIYADKLARTGRFEHDPDNTGPAAQGENLWMGTRNAFGYAEMAGGWVDERKMFKPGIFPDNSTTGRWSDVGHYTQIIWPTNTHMGCALASSRSNDYLVCRYSPGGNIVGRDPLKG
ncbi:MAG: CAP domain-containing protein [Pseudomonadota bacterium]